jgi:hypothetical protein
MALTITHAKVSAIADDPAAVIAGEVVPSDWNADHVVSGGGMAIGDPVTSGTSASVLYVDSSGDLAQDNAGFYYDDSLEDLHIGGVYYIDATPALYRVPNVSGDNWFDAGAGNLSISGYQNFGTGPSCLSSLTSGFANFGIGNFCLTSLTTGVRNFAIGSSALLNCTTAIDNFAIGGNLTGITTGSSNLAVGRSIANAGTTILQTIGVGFDILNKLGNGGTAEQQNIGFGQGIATNMTTGGTNVFMGFSVAQSLATGSNNVLIGYVPMLSATTSSSYNVMIGFGAAVSATSANNCTILGAWYGPSASISNLIVLTDGSHLGNAPLLDRNYTNAEIWSIRNTAEEQGLHVYNTSDNLAPPVDYERGVFDWRSTANVLSIGTEAGGTGTTRNMQFIIGGTNKLDYGVTTASVWTFAVKIAVPGAANPVLTTTATITSGAGAGAGTLTNAPAAGDPTTWIPINDNGTTRYIPAW